MLKRLLMSLLVLCLALPAAAMPMAHSQSPAAPVAAAAMGDHHHQHHQMPSQQHDGQAAPHDCIGCIAPYASGGALPAPKMEQALRLRPALVTRLTANATGPETPPPRA